MAPHSELLTEIIESVFDSHGHDPPELTTRPIYERTTVRPIYKRPPVGPVYVRRNLSPFHERRAMIPIDKKPTTPRPFLQTTTTIPFWKRPFIRFFPETHTVRPIRVTPTFPSPKIVESRNFSGLEFLWVALGGVAVLVLMAIFMKLGKPIRRASRQLSNSRRSPNANVSRRPNAGNSHMDLPLLGSDTAAVTDPAPHYDDLPPPYSECVRSSTNKSDSEEPPPRFSDCYVSYTNPKDAEPQVHIRRQNILSNRADFSSDIDKIQNGVIKNVSVATTNISNDSEVFTEGMRTEFVFANGRVVQQNLYLNSR